MSRTELRVVQERLREMRLEIGALNRRIRASESEKSNQMLASRRAVLWSNLILAVATFARHTVRAFRDKERLTGLRRALLVPRGLARKSSVAAYAWDAMVAGAGSSTPFFLAYLLLRTGGAETRNLGFFVSCLHSLLQTLRGSMPVPNSVSILLNAVYVVARHYYLHGLGSVGWVAYLH